MNYKKKVHYIFIKMPEKYTVILHLKTFNLLKLLRIFIQNNGK